MPVNGLLFVCYIEDDRTRTALLGELGLRDPDTETLLRILKEILSLCRATSSYVRTTYEPLRNLLEKELLKRGRCPFT